MAKPISVGWLDAAWDRMQQLPPTQYAQVTRLIASLRLSPEAGRYWVTDLDGDKLFIALAHDAHVVHRIIYRTLQPTDLLLIYDVLTFPWTHDDAGPP